MTKSYLLALACTMIILPRTWAGEVPLLVVTNQSADGSYKFTKSTYTYKSADPCTIKADVYRLPGPAVSPVILWIHGGALISGGRGNLRRDQLERYLQSGFGVVSIDYRLAPETKLPLIIEDLRDAYQWVRSHAAEWSLNPRRIAVIGHSAGGYLTLMAGFKLEPPPQALVSFYGYGDIVGPWYSQPDPFYSRKPAVSKEEADQAVAAQPISEETGRPRGKFYLYCRQNGLWPREVTGHDPASEPGFFSPYCPVRNVTRQYPPTLLLHGDQDTDVPYDLSVAMAAELKKRGVQHEFISLEGRGHGFDGGNGGLADPLNAQTFERVLVFLREHLKP